MRDVGFQIVLAAGRARKAHKIMSLARTELSLTRRGVASGQNLTQLDTLLRLALEVDAATVKFRQACNDCLKAQRGTVS